MEGAKVQETRLRRQVKDTHGLARPPRRGPGGEWAQVNELVKERRGLLLPSCFYLTENREAQGGRVVISQTFLPCDL